MSEWWTYSLADFLLFSPQTYYRLFELHNAALWPGHVLAIALGLAILVLLGRVGRSRNRVVPAILAVCWAWVAWSFLLNRYATINWAAGYAAGAFAIQALLLVLIGALGGRLAFGIRGNLAGWIGLGLFLFALLIQPLISPLVGRAWSQAEVFAVTPDPTALATLGLLVLATGGARWALLPIPLAWCAVSGATAWAMGSPDALLPPLAAALAIAAASRPDPQAV